MKNVLDFNIQFSNLMGRSFPNCFAGVYVYLENIFDTLPKKCGKERYCFGCGCSRDVQSTYFVLFDTLCGRSSLYCRLDGAMTDIAALIDDDCRVGSWSGGGTDYTVDFLFGFTGYEYRKITDSAAFKDEVITAIGAGKPVLAKVASNDGEFCVITGYDGDAFISSFYHTDQDNNTQEKRTITLTRDEIKTLYVIGNKTAPRFTLKDGLERIKQVINSTFNEKIWDDGIAYVSAFEKMSADELTEVETRVKYTFMNQFNSHIFGAALKHLPKVYDKDQFPALPDLWEKLRKCIATPRKYAFNRGNVLGISLPRAEFSKKLATAIKGIMRTYGKMLLIIDEAIEVLDKK